MRSQTSYIAQAIGLEPQVPEDDFGEVNSPDIRTTTIAVICAMIGLLPVALELP